MRERSKLPKYAGGENAEGFNSYFKLTTIIVVILGILAAMWFWGLAILSNLDAFWKIFNPQDETAIISHQAKTPPPPYLEPLPGATKEDKITVQGFAPEAALVKLFLNDQEFGSARADKEGAFAFFNVPLSEGANNFYAKTNVGGDVESAPSPTATVLFLKKPPKLEVSEPSDHAEFRQKENVITVRGQTDPRGQILINGQKVLVTGEGVFSYLFPLTEGENKIVVEALDEAGNKTTTEKTVTFSRTF